MMDSHDTNQPLKQGELEEEKKAVEVSEEITETPAEETIVEKPTENASKLSTKEEVLLRLKEVAQDAENANKQELDGLKQTFYKIHNAEIEAAKKTFVENGGAEEEFIAQPSSVEEEFKSLMAAIKEKEVPWQLRLKSKRKKIYKLNYRLSKS